MLDFRPNLKDNGEIHAEFRRYGTQQSHLSTLRRWILPRWGDCLLEQVKAVDVEEWLRLLPLAPKSKINIRSLFHLVYVHARRWELTDANPIELVRQSGGRKTIPRTLSAREIGLLLRQLAEPYRTMVLVAGCLGLRVSEIIGLQWGDFYWEDLNLLVKRSVVHGRIGDTKTEASQLPLPIDARLARILQEHWKRSMYRQPQDWVFASRDGRPRWQESILHRQLKPAALRAGLGRIGWHTFRHYAGRWTIPGKRRTDSPKPHYCGLWNFASTAARHSLGPRFLT